MPDLAGRSLLHYRLVHPIGAGGMGEVWRARDTKLQRDVAIKILPSDQQDDSDRRERFLWEARAASALIHPSIVTIHEINSSDGFDFIVMEHVRGTSLATVIAGTRLLVRDVLAHAIQIGEALAVAHAAGVVHRDLKPANIMITGSGLIKVLDFGIAKRMSASTDVDTTARALTVQGVILGTPAYMSPEQAVGQPVDARSDLFSLGVVLYQMLAGERPFVGDSNVTVLRRIVFDSPRPLQQIAPGIPQELCAVVDRCLAKEASDRYPDAVTLVRDLRRIATSLNTDTADASSAPTIAAEDRLRTTPQAPSGARQTNRRSRIAAAVVAFTIIVVAVAFLGRPLLERLRGARTPPELSLESVTGSPRELAQRARELLGRYDKAGHIDGAIRLSEAAVRNDPTFAPGYATLAQSYLRKGIGSSDKHWLNLAADSARQAVATNRDLAAAHEVLGAVLLEQGDTAGAKSESELALKLDPGSSGAYILLAKLTAKSDQARAAQFYEQAIARASGEWIPQAEYGIFHYRNGRFTEAISAWESAKRSAPDNVRVLNNLAAAYHMLDDYESAASTLQAALLIDPSAATWNNLGTVRFFQGRYSDSVAAFENARQRDATNYQYWGNLGDAYRWAAGQRDKAASAYGEAIRLLQQRLTRTPDDIEARSRLALYFAKSGAEKPALEELDRLVAAKSTGADHNFKKAVAYEVLGQREPALLALGNAVRAGYSLHQIENDPELASLRSDVRYHQLVTSLAKK